jgi:WD40 repeat protein
MTPMGTPLIGHTGWVTSVAFGGIDAEPVIVSGSDDSTIRLWEARTIPHDASLTVNVGEVVLSIDIDNAMNIVVALNRGLLMLEVCSMP